MTASTTQFSRGDVISRKYEIEAHLGDGLYGASYRARHITSGRKLVIKFLRADLLNGENDLNSFKAAFQEAKDLRHPGLVRFGEINTHHSTTYYTQEYFKSQSLRQLMDEYRSQGRSFSLHEVCQLTVKTLEAIHAAHEAGLVHGNLKPENILVHSTRTGPSQDKVVRHVKLTGTGLSSTLQNIKSLVEFDSRPEYVYQAPELATFTKESSTSIDVYSVGVIFYEMLSGQVPGTPFIYPKSLRDELPEHVNQIIDVALSASAEDRYPTAVDMVVDVQRCLQTEMLAVSKPTSLRNILLSIGGLVALSFLAIIYLSGREQEDISVTLEAQNKELRDEVAGLNGSPEGEPQEIAGMAFIPAGWYLSGRMPSEEETLMESAETPVQKRELDAFYIDRYEYNNTKGQVPVAGISQARAGELCEEQGKRLCSADEWEKACKGSKNYIYSYGDSFDAEVCGPGMDSQYKSGERTDCRSFYNHGDKVSIVYDMSGGFQEWTATPGGDAAGRYLIKGGVKGTWSPEASIEQQQRVERGYRCAYAVDRAQGFSNELLSFRCCMDVPETVQTEGGTEE
ncbi:MAG: protein kinase [Myxococcota bacterium]|nr:protein kinase [Myxococcota bacterium]